MAKNALKKHNNEKTMEQKKSKRKKLIKEITVEGNTDNKNDEGRRTLRLLVEARLHL